MSPESEQLAKSCEQRSWVEFSGKKTTFSSGQGTHMHGAHEERGHPIPVGRDHGLNIIQFLALPMVTAGTQRPCYLLVYKLGVYV